MTLGEFFTVEHLSTLEGVLFFVFPIAFMLIGNLVALSLGRWRVLKRKRTSELYSAVIVFYHVLQFGMAMTLARYMLMRVCCLSDEASFFLGILIAIVYYVCEMFVYHRTVYKSLKKASSF